MFLSSTLNVTYIWHFNTCIQHNYNTVMCV